MHRRQVSDPARTTASGPLQPVAEIGSGYGVRERITKIRSREKRVSLEETSQFARTVFSNLL